MPEISVIIPVHLSETAHHTLEEFFEKLNDNDLEMIVTTGKNRANAMNKGVNQAKGNFLWFIHADTILFPAHISALKLALSSHPDDLHYFDLSFDHKGIMSLNSFGANIRSRLFKLPWGDQAFCLSKKRFQQLGCYDETTPYGEDHLLVWQAHQKKVKLHHIPLAVITSGRQYKKNGWLKLTVQRQYLWLKQAIPEFVEWLRS